MNGSLHDDLAAARLAFLHEQAQRTRSIPRPRRRKFRERIGVAIVHFGERVEGCSTVRATASLR